MNNHVAATLRPLLDSLAGNPRMCRKPLCKTPYEQKCHIHGHYWTSHIDGPCPHCGAELVFESQQANRR